MSFLQAYYTSCETGLRGSKGFQINAASDSINPSVLQQIERLGLYVPPISAPSRPTAEEIEGFPVSLLYQRLSDGGALLAQAKYLGTDYSGRFGNYFTHSLVALDPAQDIKGKGLLPVELWRSETWETRESASKSLAPLDEPRAGSVINLEAVEEFLHENNRMQHLPRFLTAVEDALSTGRRIIIVADDETIALWIAAASYSLPSHLALRLTFNTYVKNPYQSESLIVGTTSDSDFKFASHEIEHQYSVFDFQGERFTPIVDVSGFAVEIAAAYRDNNAEGVAGFSSFAEQFAPEVKLEELDTAFACHALISGFATPETDTARIIKWCAGHLAHFKAEQIRSLLSDGTSKVSFSREIVEAHTDLFLAAGKAEIPSEISELIERPYLEWLIRDLSVSAATEVVLDVLSRLQISAKFAGELQPLRLLWLKQLRQIEEPRRLCVLLQLGDKLGFLNDPDEMLRHLGKTNVGPALANVAVQRIVAGLTHRMGMRDVVYGIGEYLATQVSQPQGFTGAAEWLGQPELFNLLVTSATEQKNLDLYFRLMAAQASLSTGRPDAHLNAFKQCLAAAQQFRVALTAEKVSNAFAVIWQGRSPTLAEAADLLDLLQAKRVSDPGITRCLVSLLVVTEEGLSDPKQKELLQRLRTLGDQTLTVAACHFANCLLEGQDAVIAIEDALAFLKQYFAGLDEQTRITIYTLIARRLINVKDEDAHRNLLIETYRSQRGGPFLGWYGQEIAASLAKHSSGKEREVARLFRIWVASERTQGGEMSNFLLTDVLPKALQSWRAKDLEAVEKGLVQSRTAHLRWVKWRESFQEQGGFDRMKQWFRFR